MPGPASGGGGFGGGRSGGSFGGGGGYGHRPGGYYGGYRRGMRFGFFPGFGFYRPFGFFGGGFFGFLMFPIILLLVVAFLLFNMVSSAVSNVMSGGVISYDESAYQKYAINEYYEHFDSTDATFEDNILISVLINENYDYGYFIAITGNNVSTPVVNEFRADGNYTFARAMNSFVQDYYEFSLHNDLARVVDTLTASVKNMSPLKYPSGRENPAQSKLVNDSSLTIDATYLEYSLDEFTDATGIPLVIVVDEMEDVFGKSIPVGDIITFIILIAVAIVAIVLIVKGIKKRKNNGGNNYNGGGYDNGSGDYRYGYGGGYNNGYNSGNYDNNGSYYN